MHEYYTHHTTSDYRVGVGTFCAAKSVREESWCHVRVTSVHQDDVDGNIETHDVSGVQSLQKMLAILQTEAVTLSGVMPSDNVRGKDAIIIFPKLACHSCLFAEFSDVTTRDGAYAVNLLNTGMSVAEKMVDDQITATINKRRTVTFARGPPL